MDVKASDTSAGMYLALLGKMTKKAQCGQDPRRAGFRPAGGPGSPCQVEAGALVVQQLPHQRPELPEPVLHVHLPLLGGGGG